VPPLAPASSCPQGDRPAMKQIFPPALPAVLSIPWDVRLRLGKQHPYDAVVMDRSVNLPLSPSRHTP
jgi:hypothetical protein